MTVQEAITIATPIGTFLSVIFGLLYAKWLAIQADRKRAETNTKIETVKADVGEVKKQAGETHSLINSAKGAMLLSAAADKRLIAQLSGNDPGMVALATQAQKLYDEHMVQQAALDKKVSENTASGSKVVA